MYRVLRDPTKKNPNPVFVQQDAAYATSKQVTDYLLCEACEQRFRRLGEDWIMSNCYRDKNTFRIRDLVQAAEPLSPNKNIQVYETARIPSFDSDSLIYFAMSVIWRASVHTWSVNGRPYQIHLGPYEERVRAFLLQESGFPDGIALITRISTHPTIMEIGYLPEHATKDGYQLFKFAIPGLVFMVLVGGKIPQGDLTVSTAPASGRYISIHAASEMRDFYDLAEFVQSVG